MDVRQHSEVNVIRLKGKLRLGEPVDTLRTAMDSIFENGRAQIVLNLSDVQMIDSSGIGVIVRGLTTAKQRGGSVKLVNPSKLAIQTLKLVGIAGLFEIYDEEAPAIASFPQA